MRVAEDGGVVVITRFACDTWLQMLKISLIHTRIKLDVRKNAVDFIGAKTFVDYRERTILSVTLWRSASGPYSMGGISRHVLASRTPAAIGVTTSCGVFRYIGDWKAVMFGANGASESPLNDQCSLQNSTGARGNERNNHDASTD